ncbi:MAG TPA: hypothetical protein VM100_04845 [Longimicrobiales bacterium]|nr:hypothetical protein [Longimicrobiales bacterium]
MIANFILQRKARFKRRQALALIPLLFAACVTALTPGGGKIRNGGVTAWTEDLNLQSGWAIYLRNDMATPIRITSITLYNCVNISGGCQTEDPHLVLQPNETRRVRRVEPAFPNRQFTFRWRYQWKALSEYPTTLDEAVASSVLSGVKMWSVALRADSAAWYWGFDFGAMTELWVKDRLEFQIKELGGSVDTANAVRRRNVSVRNVVVQGDTARVLVTLSTSWSTPCSWRHNGGRYRYFFIRMETGWRYVGGTPPTTFENPATPNPPCDGRGAIP